MSAYDTNVLVFTPDDLSGVIVSPSLSPPPPPPPPPSTILDSTHFVSLLFRLLEPFPLFLPSLSPFSSPTCSSLASSLGRQRTAMKGFSFGCTLGKSPFAPYGALSLPSPPHGSSDVYSPFALLVRLSSVSSAPISSKVSPAWLSSSGLHTIPSILVIFVLPKPSYSKWET